MMSLCVIVAFAVSLIRHKEETFSTARSVFANPPGKTPPSTKKERKENTPDSGFFSPVPAKKKQKNKNFLPAYRRPPKRLRNITTLCVCACLLFSSHATHAGYTKRKKQKQRRVATRRRSPAISLPIFLSFSQNFICIVYNVFMSLTAWGVRPSPVVMVSLKVPPPGTMGSTCSW